MATLTMAVLSMAHRLVEVGAEVAQYGLVVDEYGRQQVPHVAPVAIQDAPPAGVEHALELLLAHRSEVGAAHTHHRGRADRAEGRHRDADLSQGALPVQHLVVVVDHRREVVREVIQPARRDVEPLGMTDVPVAVLGCGVTLRGDARHGVRVDESGLDNVLDQVDTASCVLPDELGHLGHRNLAVPTEQRVGRGLQLG
eukprot:scaffold78537_cov65-Phaeocystis_antarctica.AAC.1